MTRRDNPARKWIGNCIWAARSFLRKYFIILLEGGDICVGQGGGKNKKIPTNYNFLFAVNRDIWEV